MPERKSDRSPQAIPAIDLESTASLIHRIRHGDDGARETLIRRYLAPLKRWAHGRLPVRARDLLDTDDLVQNTLLRTLKHIESFAPEREGAFLAFLRQALLNQIRDELRRVGRRPGAQPLETPVPGGGPSPLEEAIGSETLRAYDRALLALPSQSQEAVILRIEMGFSYKEIAAALGFPSANAARMAIARALVHLARAMRIPDE